MLITLYVIAILAVLAAAAKWIRECDREQERRRVSRARIQQYQDHPHDTPAPFDRHLLP